MKNYKKIDYFESIAMKCNKEQFEEIKTILERNNIEIKQLTCFNNCNYLTNNLEGFKNKVSNIGEHNKNDRERNVHETFNAETFLKACGIISEPLYQLTAKEIKHAYENPQYLKYTFKEVFETELEVGRWYKDKYNCLIYYNGLKKSYGFNTDGEFCIDNELCYFNWRIENENEPATEQEVFEALKKEIEKRYKVGDTIKNHQGTFVLNEFDLTYTDKYNNGVFTRQDSGIWLIMDGVWAQVLDQPKQLTISEIEKILGYKILIKE